MNTRPFTLSDSDNRLLGAVDAMLARFVSEDAEDADRIIESDIAELRFTESTERSSERSIRTADTVPPPATTKA